MIKFKLKQGDFTLIPFLIAQTEDDAWKQINMMGIRNRSKTLQLVQIDKDDF